MKNQFEGLSDRLLFKISTKIYESLSNKRIVINQSTKFDDEIVEIINDSIKSLGFNSTEYIEDEFLYEVVRLNLQDITYGSLSGQLVRPELTEYEFDTNVTETVYQSQTWRNTISSYGNPYDLIKTIDYYGDFDYYDGREIDTEIFDSTTDEIKIDRGSFTKV